MTEQDSRTTAICRVRPSGWSYPDWNGIVYPRRRGRGFDELAFIADYFDAVEVNVSFYRPVPPKTSAQWVRRTAEHSRFKFTVKLHQSFTHERQAYSRGAVDQWLEGIKPLSEASRVGCLLLQFPWSFRRSPESVDWLKRLADDFGGHPLVVELRHDSWEVPETLAELHRRGISLCNIDQPQLPHCVAPSAHATGRVGYVRLHGRRADTWFAQRIESFERYNYLYSTEELDGWLPRIRQLGTQCDEVYVFANNHYRGQGPANALQIKAMLDGHKVDVPPQLVEHFPALADVRIADSAGFRETLF